MTVKIVWRGPGVSTRRASIWAVQHPQGTLIGGEFTSKRAATFYAWSQGWKVAR